MFFINRKRYEIIKEIEEYNSYNDKLSFEGEYLTDKRNEKGKEYDENYFLIVLNNLN